MLSRRELLRTGVGAAAALTVPALDLAPLADAARKRADYRLGFTSLHQELSLERLPQHGALPDWLSGTLVRNGPALYEAGAERFNHWFDGLAMLHAFSFRGGRVSYANRFLRSSQYAAVTKRHRIEFSEFATDPCRSIFKGAASMFVPPPIPNGNVNVTAIAERFVALTELPLPVRFDPHTLRTLGVDGPPLPLARVSTAHPHVDQGQRFRYEIPLAPTASYVVYRDDVPFAEVPVDQASYLHSFGITQRYVVLADYPFTFDTAAVVARGWRPFIENYRWDGSRPARFYVVDRANGTLVARLETDPFFAFHHINAFERDGTVVVDLLAYDDAEIVDALYLKRLRNPRGSFPPSQARRYTLDLARGTVTRSVLGPGVMELPRINYAAHNTKPYRFMYAAALRSPASRFLDELVKLDVTTGERRTWREAGCFPGEAVFVPAPSARSEDDGVALSVVLDTRTRTSFLLVLDAKTFAERARATVPHHIPFGFHGQLF